MTTPAPDQAADAHDPTRPDGSAGTGTSASARGVSGAAQPGSSVRLADLSEAQSAALLSAVPNFRDVGGFPTSNGRRLRNGTFFRTGELAGLTGEAQDAFAALNVANVYDLRTAAERDPRPDRVPPGVEVTIADVLADAPTSGAAALAALLKSNSPTVSIDDVNAAIGAGKGHAMMVATYRDFIELGSANTAYRRFFTGVAVGRSGIAFHCTAGKDRTGWGAAILQLFAGLDHATVMSQYLVSNERTGAAFGALVAAFGKAGGDQDSLQQLIDVHPEYLDAGLNAMTDKYGTLEDYLRGGLNLTDDDLAALMTRLVE